MVNIQTDNDGDDRFSPGVGYCADLAYRERSELMGSVSDRTVGVGHPVTLIWMASESMREPRVFGSPMACRRTGISSI